MLSVSSQCKLAKLRLLVIMLVVFISYWLVKKYDPTPWYLKNFPLFHSFHISGFFFIFN